jgi:anaerobic selenocysteine-containing dehydrogenase
VVSIEGDRHHPINEGTLCSKGAAAVQVTNNPLRLKDAALIARRAATAGKRSPGTGCCRASPSA